MIIFRTFLVAWAGGYFFSRLHTPLPWTLGPMAAVLVWSLVLKKNTEWPDSIRNTALLFLGYVMGSPFTIETAQRIASQLPLTVSVTIALVAVSILFAVVTSRYFGISMASNVLGSIPGGLAQMVLLAEEVKEADTTIVTFMQTARLLSVVFIVPFLAAHSLPGETIPLSVSSDVNAQESPAVTHLLAFTAVVLSGFWAACRLSLPTPHLLGPIVGTALLVCYGLEPPAAPPVLLAAAQLAVGTYMGLLIQPSRLSNWRGVLGATTIGVAAIIVSALLISYILNRYFHFTQVTAFLSAAPGGVAEMGLTAIVLHADVSTTVAFGTFRMFFVLLAVPPFLKRWLGKRTEDESGAV
jgi:membrane AbrB-like protein